MGGRGAGGALRRLPRLARRIRCHGGLGRRSPGGDRGGDGTGVPGRRERHRHCGGATGTVRRARRPGADPGGADLRHAGPARGRGRFADRVRACAVRRRSEARGRRARIRRAGARAGPVRARVERVARPLRIGESVFGKIVTAVTPRAVTVPVAALVPTAGGESFQVFVVDSEQVAHVRPVTVGGRSETMAEITFGLHAGEVVVTNGAYGVADGAKILRAAPGPR